jgi:hypothetical protein
MNVAHIDDEIIPFVSRLFRLYAQIVFSMRDHRGLSSFSLIESQIDSTVKVSMRSRTRSLKAAAG